MADTSAGLVRLGELPGGALFRTTDGAVGAKAIDGDMGYRCPCYWLAGMPDVPFQSDTSADALVTPLTALPVSPALDPVLRALLCACLAGDDAALAGLVDWWQERHGEREVVAAVRENAARELETGKYCRRTDHFNECCDCARMAAAVRSGLAVGTAGGGADPGACRTCGGRGRIDPPCDTCDGVGRVADPDSEYTDATQDCPDCNSEPCPECGG